MFSNKDLRNMIVPIFLEQLLLLLVGIVDTFNISYCGEAAVSGVSLVNQFNYIFITLSSALASGGAVIISQYIGSCNKKKTVRSSSQLLMFSAAFSIVLSVLVFAFHRQILRAIFGKVTDDVMDACVTYLRISIYSYVFLGIYNAGAAVQRSMGNTKVTMYISIISNMINVAGNCLGIYVLHAGVAGVAWPTFIARLFSAIVVTYLCFKKRNARYELRDIFTADRPVLSRIMKVAIPNGLENGIFEFVKVSLTSLVALFGTYQIAANGVAQSIWSLSALMTIAMGPIFITVIGRCMGASDPVQARFYFKKLLKINIILAVGWNLFVLAVMPFFIRLYHLEPETKKLIIILVIIHNSLNGIALPHSSSLGFGLRAAGDVKFTMLVSIFSTVFVRLLSSYILAMVLNMGVIGIAIAMDMDWVFKGTVYLFRVRSDRWEHFKII